MKLAYDLDGTIVDTEWLIRMAYEAAGAEPPPDFFGKPFREWSNDTVMHERKNEVYFSLLASYTPRILPVGVLALHMGGRILTGASKEAAVMVFNKIANRKLFGTLGLTLYADLSMIDKANHLNAWDFTGDGIMFEDHLPTVEYLRSHTRWTICHTR